MKTIIIYLLLLLLPVLLLLSIFVVIRLRLATPEDSWICVDGQWVKHGKPDSVPPDFGCTPEHDVLLYYYNPEKDKDDARNILCSRQGLVTVNRTISSNDPIADTVNLLLKGDITGEEKTQGITSEFPLSGLMLEQTSIEDGIVSLTFSDPEHKTSGGACRTGILWFQIEETVKQFENVREVRFLPEDLFQP